MFDNKIRLIHHITWLCFLLIVQQRLHASDLAKSSGLDDDLEFLFKWPGNLNALDDELKQKADIVDILTNNNEKYRCTIPIISDEDNKKELETKKDSDVTNKQLIKTSTLLDEIYTKKLCSYRIESYWIYELCHGQYIKQYHETKSAGKRLVTNEYFLGYYDANKQDPDYYKKNDDEMIPNIHWRPLGGDQVAMFAVKYTDGTPCEILSNTPRETTVFYACDEFGNDNVVGFEEISSCVYEMVVITKWICSHPAYRVPDKVFQTISCFSADETSPAKPKELTDLENEQLTSKSEQNKIKMTDQHGSTFIVHYKTHMDPDDTASGENTDDLDESLNPNAQPDSTAAPPPSQSQQQQQQQQKHHQTQLGINDEAQREMISSFLSGSQCLNGGSGWWKYEVCYGRHVVQYHEDEKTKKRTNILLGSWNMQAHKDWIVKYPNKRILANKNDRTSASFLYTNGDFCEITMKPRTVEVKLKCIRNKEKFHAISLYLLEPATCEYLLAIESTWLCDYIETLDAGISITEKETGTTNPAVP